MQQICVYYLCTLKLYVTSCFPLDAFNFAILITTYLSVDIFGFILFGTLCALNLDVCFLPQVREVLSYYVSNFSLSSRTPRVQMLIYLMLSQRSLKVSSFLKILFPFFSIAWEIFTTLYSSSLIWSSVLSDLLFIS